MNKVIVETSARHIHLTDEAVEILYGKGAELIVKKMLSQPGQFATGNEKIKLVGPKGEMKVSINFGAFKTVSIPANLINAPYGGEGALFIGQDAIGNYQHGKMTVTVDEFMVFDHALNSEDLSKLAESYGK